MKQLWVRVDPWDKKLVTTALESGADALWVFRAGPWRQGPGLITGGAGRRPGAGGRDVQEVAITSTADEAEVIRLAARTEWCTPD
jgi:3-dehydroquinate synthase II